MAIESNKKLYQTPQAFSFSLLLLLNTKIKLYTDIEKQEETHSTLKIINISVTMIDSL